MRDEENRTPNYKCDICGKPIYVRPNRLAKQKWGACCSKECGLILRSMNTKGEKNHQHGLRGILNSSFKSEINIKANNKLTERYIYVGEWYKKKSMNGRITLHRYQCRCKRSSEHFEKSSR